MAKPRYRRTVVGTRSHPRLRGKTTIVSVTRENHDQISDKEIYVTSPEDNVVTYEPQQQDYYPWDSGAHIITEDIDDFQINEEFEYLTTDADKTHRDVNGNIISQNDSSEIGQDFVVVPQRYVLEKTQYIDVLDVEITELIEPVEYGPTGPPILRENPTSGETTGIIIFPTHGTVDGKITDDWSIFDDPMVASVVYQFPANHSRVLVADAYNYLGDDDAEIEDGLEYEWVFNSDNPSKHGLETRKKITNKVVSKSKKLSLINGTKFDTGYYYCRIKNEKGTIETPQIYILCFGGLIIEREEIRDPDGNFIGYGAPTGELIEDQKHNLTSKKTDGWMDYDLENEEWYRTAWDSISEEWYTRDSYNTFNPWRTPKYGPEPTPNDDVKERVAEPTKTSVVSKSPETDYPQPRPKVVLRQAQQVAVNRVRRNNRRGRSKVLVNPSK